VHDVTNGRSRRSIEFSRLHGNTCPCLAQDHDGVFHSPRPEHRLRHSIPGIEYIGRGSLESVAQLNLGEEFNPVLPGGTRELLVAMSGNLEPGDYVVEFVVQYGGEAPLYLVHEFTVN